MTTSEIELAAAGEIAQRQPFGADILTKPMRRGLFAAAVGGCGILLFFAYLGQAKTLPVYSDGASQALQAWDMLHGNVLLRGWSLSDVPFYTTELVQYMLIELVRGLTGDVVHIAAAMTYTLLVVGVALLARGDATGREGLIRMLIASGILLAPPLGWRSTTWVVLNYPDHTGTQVPLLVIWLLLDRVRPRWWLPVLITAILTWVQIADTMALYEGVLPLVVVCGVRVLGRRGRLGECWYELALAAGALLSAYLATQTLLLIRRAGGFEFVPPANGFSSIGGMSEHIWVKLQDGLIVFGANFFGMPLRYAVVPLLHLIGVGLVLWAVAVAVRRFIGPESLMIQVVTATFVTLLAAFTFGFRGGAWEAIGLLPAGAVLAGRLLPERLTRAHLVIPLAAVLACLGVSLYRHSTAPDPPSFNVRVVRFLEAHHLRYGLSAYWQGNSDTLISHDQVQVRAIGVARDSFFLTYWNTNSTWYDPRRHDATFIIWPRSDARSLRNIEAAAGPPVRTYRLGGYVLMVWRKNLLDGPFIKVRRVPWDILAVHLRGPAGTRRAAGGSAAATAPGCRIDAIASTPSTSRGPGLTTMPSASIAQTGTPGSASAATRACAIAPSRW